MRVWRWDSGRQRSGEGEQRVLDEGREDVCHESDEFEQ